MLKRKRLQEEKAKQAKKLKKKLEKEQQEDQEEHEFYCDMEAGFLDDD